jgi:hypothetical protein
MELLEVELFEVELLEVELLEVELLALETKRVWGCWFLTIKPHFPVEWVG